MKPKIGIMGSAIERGTGGKITLPAKKLAYELGREIARHNCILINGACKGIPDDAARGAKDNDGFVIGISPAGNLEEHSKRYKFPTKNYDVIIFTGFGFKGRNVVNVTNCDATIIVAGRVGTLNEFTIAYDEGQIIGVMQGSGGIADHLRQLIKIMNKKTGATVIYDKNPHTLVKKLLTEINKRRKIDEQID
ncbi:LOG family protein [Candidatus Woesearchaeota archaeon]|nr:LOG family protein [Candidatus Woesearchaeota archaeon]